MQQADIESRNFDNCAIIHVNGRVSEERRRIEISLQIIHNTFIFMLATCSVHGVTLYQSGHLFEHSARPQHSTKVSVADPGPDPDPAPGPDLELYRPPGGSDLKGLLRRRPP